MASELPAGFPAVIACLSPLKSRGIPRPFGRQIGPWQACRRRGIPFGESPSAIGASSPAQWPPCAEYQLGLLGQLDVVKVTIGQAVTHVASRHPIRAMRRSFFPQKNFGSQQTCDSTFSFPARKVAPCIGGGAMRR